MKLSEITKERPEGAKTPKEHAKDQSQIGAVIGDLRQMKGNMADGVKVAQTNNEIMYQLLDQMVKAREEAQVNTDRVITAVQELISALKSNPK